MPVLAELNVRSTRRHMPTRRVAVDPGFLPLTGRAYGAVLLGAVMAEFLPELPEDELEALPRFLAEARKGRLRIPSIALRYRLQTDTHGLDRARHRIVEEPDSRLDFGSRLIIELDVHGAAVPQVIGTIMAAAAHSDRLRPLAFRAIDAAVKSPGRFPEEYEIRRLLHGIPRRAPNAPGVEWQRETEEVDDWLGVPSERRWAMEVLGIGVDVHLDRSEVQRRFRRLLRQAHPDQGAEARGAAERIAELSEARELLLTDLEEHGGELDLDLGEDLAAEARSR
ncbi:MAG: DnaJ-like protein [Actinomycetia bacterium]|nr:DnaJ-like protein [Actinomycetes bacterium]